jgi:hypothetical protein
MINIIPRLTVILPEFFAFRLLLRVSDNGVAVTGRGVAAVDRFAVVETTLAFVL